MINVDFSVDMRRIDLWAHRMGVDLRDSVQLLEPYMLAQQYILRMVELLVEFHGFHHSDPSDNRILFAVARDTSGPVPMLTPPGRVIELPVHASSFFSPDRRLQWEYIFHSNLWFDRGHRVPGVNVAVDLLHLLQCLLPGMFLVVEVQDEWSTQRGIPPLRWLREHREVLVTSIGCARFDALCQAAADIKRAVVDSRDAPTAGFVYGRPEAALGAATMVS